MYAPFYKARRHAIHFWLPAKVFIIVSPHPHQVISSEVNNIIEQSNNSER